MWEKEKLVVQAISPFPTMLSKALFPKLAGVCGRRVECWPRNLEVLSLIPGSQCQLWDFFIGHTFGASTGVLPRKQNRERLVSVVRAYFSIDVKKICLNLNSSKGVIVWEWVNALLHTDDF